MIAALREAVPGMGADRFLSPELAAAADFTASGAVVAAASPAAGEIR